MVASDFLSKIWLLFWQPGTSRNPLKIFSHTGLVWLALCLESPPVKMHDQCSAGKEQPGAWWLHEFQANVTLGMVYWKFQSGLGSFLSRGEGIWLHQIFGLKPNFRLWCMGLTVLIERGPRMPPPHVRPLEYQSPRWECQHIPWQNRWARRDLSFSARTIKELQYRSSACEPCEILTDCPCVAFDSGSATSFVHIALRNNLSAGAKPHPFRPKRKHNAVSGYTVIPSYNTILLPTLHRQFLSCLLNWQVPTTCQPSIWPRLRRQFLPELQTHLRFLTQLRYLPNIGNRYGIRTYVTYENWPPHTTQTSPSMNIFQGVLKNFFFGARKGGRRW